MILSVEKLTIQYFFKKKMLTEEVNISIWSGGMVKEHYLELLERVEEKNKEQLLLRML